MSTITLTAESQNFTNAFFRFTGAGNAMQDDDTWNDGTTANSATKAFTVLLHIHEFLIPLQYLQKKEALQEM